MYCLGVMRASKLIKKVLLQKTSSLKHCSSQDKLRWFSVAVLNLLIRILTVISVY